MNGYFEIDEKNAENVILAATGVARLAPKRSAGSDGEKVASDLIFNEIKLYCDEAQKERFLTYPFAAAFCRKSALVLITAAAVLFKLSEIFGNATLSCIALALSLSGFCIFSYKYLFGGRALDKLFKPHHSQNLFLTRRSRSTTLNRVILTAKSDDSALPNTPFFGSKAPTVFFVLCVTGNTLTFCLLCAYLFSGTLQDSAFFKAASDFCLLMCVFYIGAFFLYSSKHTPENVTGLVPAFCAAEIMKELFSSSVRFPNTEVCVLITGSDFPCHDGACEFISRKKRAFRDIPTVFVSLEEITSTSKTAVFYNSDSESRELAEIITDSAESYGINVKHESVLSGTAMFSPFDEAGFKACSFGTSKELSGKIHEVNKTAITDTLNILKDVVRYYGNGG